MKSRKEKTLVCITFLLLISAAVYAVFNRETLVFLFEQIISGVTIVKEYVLSLGVAGVFSISFIIIVCFFFPLISSVPVQLAACVSYGIGFAFVQVVLSLFIASQLAFLFNRTVRVFKSEKQKEKQRIIEEKIANSSRSIYHFLFLAYLAPFVPFMLIHMIAASSGIKWWKYALVTFFGPMPDVIITLWIGEKITSASSPIVSLGFILLIIACVALSLIYKEKAVDLIFKPKKEKRGKNGK